MSKRKNHAPAFNAGEPAINHAVMREIDLAFTE